MTTTAEAPIAVLDDCTRDANVVGYAASEDAAADVKVAHSLETIGEALFGSRWQTDLAAEIGVSDRTMRRWVADPKGIPDGAWADIRDLCARRGKNLLELSEALA